MLEGDLNAVELARALPGRGPTAGAAHARRRARTVKPRATARGIIRKRTAEMEIKRAELAAQRGVDIGRELSPGGF